MTTYVMVVVSSDGAVVNEMNFTREELHSALNALEMNADVDGDLINKFEKICYDWTDWEDIEPDQEQREILQGSNE